MFMSTFALASLVAAAPLSTIAEQSHDVRTGDYAEVDALCSQFASAFPGRATCLTFGTTPQGRAMKVLVLSDAKDPHAVPVVL
ncbi:MAG TPA: peptidase M14, partial [Myxococcota bacterium]